MTMAQVLTFAGVVLGWSMAPGANMMLILRNLLSSGRRKGLLTAFGGCVAIFLYVVLSVAGISAALVASPTLYHVVQGGGVLYLFYLAAGSVQRALDGMVTDAVVESGIITSSRAFMDGLVTNALSPKLAVLYVTVVPQLAASPESLVGDTLLLGGIHVVIRFAWYVLFVLFVGPLRGWLMRGVVKRGIDLIMGATLIIFASLILGI
ncbi:MAG: LysE family translocator [Chloroflexota bacterium]